jgi:hypothetical protein
MPEVHATSIVMFVKPSIDNMVSLGCDPIPTRHLGMNRVMNER